MNNEAVALIQLQKYGAALTILSSALKELNHQVKSCSVPNTLTSSSSMITSNNATPLDQWMEISTTKHARQHSLVAPQDDSSLFLFRDGIVLSPLPDAIHSEEASYKELALVLFFNQGLVHHLCYSCCQQKSLTNNNEAMAAMADRLYRLSLQFYHKGKRRPSQGRFLLACCNNLAVLKRQYISTASTDKDVSKDMVFRFSHLGRLLRKFKPSPTSTREEVALWQCYMENVIDVIMIRKGHTACCAGAG